MKEQDKTSEELSETRSLPDEELKIIIIKMLKERGRRLDEQSEKLEVYNKDLENIKKSQTIKNIKKNQIIIERKNTLEGINSRLNDTEEWIRKLEDRVVEITETEEKKRKKKE